MGMIFIFEFATIDPIEEKCEHFEVSSEIFLSISESSSLTAKGRTTPRLPGSVRYKTALDAAPDETFLS